MKVFISSVITGYEEQRAAVEDAVTTLGHEVLRAEDFGASSDSPRVACLEGIRQSDLVILLLGERYGPLQPSGLSATHEEFREARDRKEVLAFVEDVPAREEAEAQFLREVQDWNRGLFTELFRTPHDLRRSVTRVLHQRIVEDTRAPQDGNRTIDRCLSLFPTADRINSPAVVVGVAGGPAQSILRPKQVESPALADRLFEIGLQGPHAILNRREGTDTAVEGNAIVLSQPSQWISVHGDGSIVINASVSSGEMHLALIEESVREVIQRAIGLSNDILTEIDELGRVRHVCVAAAVLAGNYLGWRTRAEENANPHSIETGWGQEERPPVFLDPAVRPRASIRSHSAEIAEDLTILLRRQFR